ncbi:MAG: glycosyl transferase family 39, partial [Deltaproteobacteria bacterium]
MSRYEKAFWALAGGLFAFQLIYLAVTPYELAPDEAYYWTWSKRLAWGYFSKPPLVAAVMWLTTSLGGDTPFFVRLGAPIFAFLSYVALFYLAKGLFDERVAFWSFLLAATTAASPVGGLVMTIDPPLLAFWGLTLLFLWRGLGGKAIYWYLAGLTLGLGLLSKYTMGALVPSVFAYLLFTPRAR